MAFSENSRHLRQRRTMHTLAARSNNQSSLDRDVKTFMSPRASSSVMGFFLGNPGRMMLVIHAWARCRCGRHVHGRIFVGAHARLTSVHH
eukprot:2925719-Pyramimonas_sp.AAC.1